MSLLSRRNSANKEFCLVYALLLSVPLLFASGCGGGGSNTGTGGGTPPSNNPVPTITSLSPSLLTAGAAAQTLTISGAGFLSSSTVAFNGASHAATYLSASQLTISLTTADLANGWLLPGSRDQSGSRRRRLRRLLASPSRPTIRFRRSLSWIRHL